MPLIYANRVPLSEVIARIAEKMESGKLGKEEGFNLLTDILRTVTGTSGKQLSDLHEELALNDIVGYDEVLYPDTSRANLVNLIKQTADKIMEAYKYKALQNNDENAFREILEYPPFVELHDLVDEIVKGVAEGKRPYDTGIFILSRILEANEDELPKLEETLKRFGYLGSASRIGKIPHLVYIPRSTYENFHDFKRDVLKAIENIVEQVKKEGRIPQDFMLIVNLEDIAKKIAKDAEAGRISVNDAIKALKTLSEIVSPDSGVPIGQIVHILRVNNILPMNDINPFLLYSQEVATKMFYDAGLYSERGTREMVKERIDEIIKKLERSVNRNTNVLNA